jgi:hypothetical protein
MQAIAKKEAGTRKANHPMLETSMGGTGERVATSAKIASLRIRDSVRTLVPEDNVLLKTNWE